MHNGKLEDAPEPPVGAISPAIADGDMPGLAVAPE